MGGAVEMQQLHEFPWVLHLSELKFQLQSNVVPIGMITRGIYCHRALLFKVRLTSLPHGNISCFFSVPIPLQTLYFTHIFWHPILSPFSLRSPHPPLIVFLSLLSFLLHFSSFHTHNNPLHSIPLLFPNNSDLNRLRSLTFQCLADCIGMSCTLVRGDYNRAWNEVLLFDGNPSDNGCSSQPCRYVVDLMHQPGSLLTANTPAAVQYQTI